MIVLDEHLKGLELEEAISHWYRGRVIFINDLRPRTVIKDEAVASLLQRIKQPTFVTINHSDFWRRISDWPNSKPETHAWAKSSWPTIVE